MRFGPIPLDEAEGKILGHNIAGADGRQAFRKGKPLTGANVAALGELGMTVVYVAEFEPGDVDEDTAAQRVARAVMGERLSPSKPHVGRVNLRAISLGVIAVDAQRLTRLNECDGITLATLATGSVAQPRQTVATVKIIPFAVPESAVHTVEEIATHCGPLIHLKPLQPRTLSLILSGSPSAKERVLKSFERPLRERIEALGSKIRTVEFVTLDGDLGTEALVEMLCDQVANGTEMIILAGETAIMDRFDIAPRAIERAGGEVTSFGAPVDPGNLLMLAYLGDVPILGAPGCARSRKTNVIDWVLPRLLAREHLTSADIISLGHGGLLEDTPKRPMPRRDVT